MSPNLKQKQGTFTECAKLRYDTCINKCADNIFWVWAIHILFYLTCCFEQIMIVNISYRAYSLSIKLILSSLSLEKYEVVYICS